MLTGKGINFVHRRVITKHFDTPKTSGLWYWSSIFMALSKFLRRILYIAFNRDTLAFLTVNLGHLTLIFEKQHLNYLSVVSISLHHLGTFVTFAEPYLIIMMPVRLERIYQCLLTNSDLI